MTLVAATALTAECKEFWQLLLCQGFLTGVSCGMIFGPIPTIVSHWFKKRRSLAFGIAGTGSSIGGTVIPIATRNLIELIGYVRTSHCNEHTKGISQVQMDNASHRLDRILHARDCKLGNDLCTGSAEIRL